MRNFNKGYSLSQDKQKIIHDFQEKHGPPYLVNQLSKLFGVERVYSKEMPNNISGWIRKISDEGKYEIALNNKENLRRRRFTAAHELAHLLLHEPFIGDGVKDDVLYRSKLTTLQEVEANKLAADILMPLDKVYYFLREKRRMSELPFIFDVSNVAMCIRLGVSEISLLAS